ncbi:MAG TPA: ABC transporter permease [Symbiobacteriaceae bacterium]|nr:ABC transporter permease [Symbiobacteriaceae bacterium]
MLQNGPSATVATKNVNFRSLLSKIAQARSLGLVVAIVTLALVIGTKNSNFWRPLNLQVIALNVSFFGILAIGQTAVILTSGIDLSVGSMVALSGVVVALITKSLGYTAAIVITLGFGLMVGVIHGWLITRLNITPFIVTLASMSVLRGLALWSTQGYPVVGLPKVFSMLGQQKLLNIPLSALVLILVMIFAWLILSQTPLGRYVYAIGGNREAATYSGINVRGVLTYAYVQQSLLAAITGILVASWLGAGQPGAAGGWELNAIAAVIIGGTSLAGGSGTVSGTILGALFMAVLANGLVLLNVSPYLQSIVVGAVIMIAVIVDVLRTRRFRKT